jgi:hypothetical protein
VEGNDERIGVLSRFRSGTFRTKWRSQRNGEATSPARMQQGSALFMGPYYRGRWGREHVGRFCRLALQNCHR